VSPNEPRLVPLRVRLPYATEAEFLDKYGSNVARGGIFIATRALKPEGTQLSFEFVLADGRRLLRGDGVVVKTQVDEGGSRSGMTVRFARLDAASKALVDRVIAHRSGAVEPEDVRPVEPPAAKAPPSPSPKPHFSPGAAAAAAVSAAPKATPEPPAAAPKAAQPEPAPAPEPPAPAEASAPAAPPKKAQPEPAPAPEVPKPRRRPSLIDIPVAQPSPSAELPKAVIGIDLGTTNARVAVFRGGRAELIPLAPDGRNAIPSCVAIGPDGGFLVGDAARTRMITDPRCGVFAAKRFLGQRARSPRLRAEAAKLPYALVADAAGDAGALLGDRVYTLPQVSAALLSVMKDAAEKFLGHAVGRAVLCVPAYFTDHPRTAMREAGRLAGLEVLRIFNEPSSVALAFGYGKALPRKRILVYDLGGGTFDASVVEVTGDDLEVVATGGDNFLGGMDFDARISDALAKRFERAESRPLDPSPAAALRLREASELAKIALSDRELTQVHVAQASARPDGTPLDLRVELTRSELEEITQDLVDRTLQVTHDVLGSAGLTAQSLDEVLLVGGQTRAPLVRRRVGEALGKALRTDVDAHAAVALGAAILGHALLESDRGKRGVTLSEVLSAPIGVATRGGGFRPVLQRNTRLPAEKTVLIPAKPGQLVSVAIYQGTSERAEHNEYLGCLEAAADRAGELAVRFSVAADATLELEAIGAGGRPVQLTLSTADASDEVKAALLEQAPLPGEPEDGGRGLLRGFKKLFGSRG